MDSKLQLLNRKCAPSITAQTIRYLTVTTTVAYTVFREQVKEENAEQGYQEASQVTVSIPPCQKKFEEIKKSNEEASARTTVYTRYHTVQENVNIRRTRALPVQMFDLVKATTRVY